MVGYRSFATFCYIPTAVARAEFGSRLEAIAVSAFRAIAREGKGLEVAHLQFRHGRDVVAVSSRVRRSGEIEIDIDVGNPRLPTIVFTEEELRNANRHAGNRAQFAPRRSVGTVFHLTR